MQNRIVFIGIRCFICIGLCLFLENQLTAQSLHQVKIKAFSTYIFAQSLSRQDIQAAVDSASSGDTIILPPGSNTTFSGTVTITTDNLHIRGQGSDSTHIGWTSGANRQDPVFWVMNTTGFELSGVHLFGTNNQSQREYLVKMHYSTYFWIHHCTFERSGAACIDCWGYPMNGCIDNCTFSDGYFPGHGYAVYVAHSTREERLAVTGQGDISWDNDLELGTIDGVYIEDCTMDTFRHFVASAAGGRYIVRYCTITSNGRSAQEDIFDTHGWTSEPNRGVRKAEIYENAIDCTFDHGYVHIKDSGDGVLFNNTITNLWYPDHYAFILNLPCCNSDICNTVNGWNGTYPEHDQTQLYYVWGNTLDGRSHNIVTPSGNCSDEPADPIFLENRDWFEYEPSPEIYTPFQYPHPFRQDAVPGIALSTNSLEFSAIIGGNNPASQNYQIANYGWGILDWSVSDDAGWLTCSPASGQGYGSITVSVSSSGLAVGTYPAEITVTSPNAENSPQIIPVTLVVSSSVPKQLSIFSYTGRPATGSGGNTDPAPGVYLYSHGSNVRVATTPYLNFRFSSWSGDIGTAEAFDPEVYIDMISDKSISALFCSICGDANGDLIVTPGDAQTAFDIYLGRIQNPTTCELENADVNCDGTKYSPKVTPADAQAIFSSYLGISTLPSDCSGENRAEPTTAVTGMRRTSEVTSLTLDESRTISENEIAIPVIFDDIADLKSFGFDLVFPSVSLEFIAIDRTEFTENLDNVDAFLISDGILRVGGYGRFAGEGRTSGIMVLIFRIMREQKKTIPIIITNTVDDIKDTLVRTEIKFIEKHQIKAPKESSI